MKKLSLLLCLLVSAQTTFASDDLIKLSFLDFTPTSMDFVYEIKTSQNVFDQITLDCQSFITGMSFIKGEEVKNSVYLDMFQCEDMYNILNEAKTENLPLCIGLDPYKNSLTITRETDKCN